ncbi:MAG: radical SAM protein [Deltaproteobacteria bacterium]|nr:radical SAM protein [Deltaproteobacteria bacterium]
MAYLGINGSGNGHDNLGNLGLKDEAIEWAIKAGVETLARMPESLVRRLLGPSLSKSIPWQEGVDFLLFTLGLLHTNWRRFHPNVRRRFVENFFIHGGIRATEKRKAACDKLGDFPTTMVLSPTMRCNLRCKGCYSYHYKRNDGLSTERIDELFNECENLGIHFVVITGGEPYLRHDLVDLMAAHPHIYFMTYTNGLILAEQNLVGRLADMGNVLPCMSVEGYEAETDARRGAGTHRKIRRLMREMREAGMLFGFSATPMRHNNDILLTDQFIEYYMELGARVGWYFSYMPVGLGADLDLMPTPEQRLYRYHRIRAIRKKHNFLAADFWCDGVLTGGCLSAGRTYFHVNAEGGVEPCVFQQFYTDNINDKPLAECLASEFLTGVRSCLRDVENPLRPCPVVDNPSMLRKIVKDFNPKPSQPESINVLTGDLAKGLDKYAEDIKAIFDPVFAENHADMPWPLEPPGTWDEKEQAKKKKGH